jgi:aromatic-L-amino-acid/L-tryptophan decarboxylase
MTTHWTPEEFRANGHAVVDWLADYLAGLGDRSVQAPVAPGDILAKLPPAAPEHGEPFAALLADLDDIVLPGITHWQHPGWFAYFPASSSPPAVLAELVAAGLGAQGMLWSTSPALTEIEMGVLDWLVELMGLPATWRHDTGPGGGVIQMSASDATHTALMVARHRATAAGHATDNLVAYGSAQAHSSIEKGARVAGFRHIRLLPVDDSFAMRPEALAEAIAADIAAGLHPTFVCSAVGTTGTTAVDPVRAIGELARANSMWHHVDAAYAGSAMICPEFRHHQDGLELVDSYVFNPHKWLLTNFDCSVMWVADRAPLIDALSILPPYLKGAAAAGDGPVVDFRDWHVPLGRRFRALKLWWVLRSYGAEGLRTHIRQHVAWTAALADRLAADPRFEVVAPHPFALVCFRCVDGTEATQALAAAINAAGSAYVTPSTTTTAGGADMAFIRVSIGSTWTTEADVDALWALIDAAAG